jgi:hypothetical protein
MLTLLAFGRRRGTTEKCLRLLLDTSVEGQLRGFVRKQERAPERKAIVPDRNMGSGLWQILPSVNLAGGSAGRMNRSSHARRSIRCLRSPSGLARPLLELERAPGPSSNCSQKIHPCVHGERGMLAPVISCEKAKRSSPRHWKNVNRSGGVKHESPPLFEDMFMHAMPEQG